MPKKSLALIAIIFAILFVQQSSANPLIKVDSKTAQELCLPIYEWVDESKPQKGIIVVVHGLTLYSACWDNFARHLVALGFRVYALDQRGFGRWRSEASKFGGNDKIEIAQSQQDLLDLVTILRQKFSNQKLFILGESLGSNMSLLLASEHPELVDGAILAALCYKNRVHLKPRYWVEDLAKEMVKPNASLNLTPFSSPYLTNNPLVAKACDADPMINRKMTPAELVKIDILNDKAISAAKSLPADFPILLVSGSKDAMFKSSELPDLVPKFGSKRVELHLMMGMGHLILEHQKVDAQIVALIDAWLAKQIKSK